MNSQTPNIYQEQLLEILNKFFIDNAKNTINFGNKVYKIDTTLPNLISEIDIKLLKDEVYKLYNQSLNPSRDISSTNFEEIKLPDLIVQEDRFWAIDGEEKSGTIVARKNSERARIPSQSFYGIGEISLSNTIGNNKSKTFESFVHAITSRKVSRTDTEPNSNLPKESFIYQFGKNILKDEYGEDTVRFYFNLEPNIKNIKNVVGYLSNSLDEREIPYNLKYLSNIAFYNRSDSCVLYVHKQNFSIVAQVVRFVWYKYLRNNNILQKSEPFFTRKLVSGIGFAENPLKKGSSFGMFKSMQIVQGVIAYLKNQTFPLEYDVQKCLKFIVENLIFDIKTPYLNANSKYFYDFDIIDKNKKINILKYRKTSSVYLNAAQYFAKIIESKAIWLNSNERTWLTYTQKNLLDTEDIKGFRPVNINERAGIEFFLSALKNIINPTQKTKIASENFIQVATKNLESFIFENVQERLPRFNVIKDEKEAKKLANQIIKNHVEIRLPIYNQFGNFEFNPTITHGLAFYGYLFLRVYDSSNVPKITDEILAKFL